MCRKLAATSLGSSCSFGKEDAKVDELGKHDHFTKKILSKSCPGHLSSLKTPTIFYSKLFDIVLDAHVDDGYATGPPNRMKDTFRNLKKEM